MHVQRIEIPVRRRVAMATVAVVIATLATGATLAGAAQAAPKQKCFIDTTHYPPRYYGDCPKRPRNTGFPPDVTSAPEVARYDDAPRWNVDRSTCTGDLTVGAQRLRDWLRANYGEAIIGGYDCRPNTADASRTSIHGVGRAVDWSRDVGNATQSRSVASFISRLSANRAAMARAMGIQYWIWNRQQYRVRDDSVLVSGYHGPNPHTDHVHIEMNLAGSTLSTSYWR